MGLFSWLNDLDKTSNNEEGAASISKGEAVYQERKGIAKYNQQLSDDLNKIVGFYKKYGGEYANENISIEAFVEHVAPKSDSHTCPYCGVVHDFTASRARKCPDCGKKMTVRAGRYLTQLQVDEIEIKAKEYYDKSYCVNRIKNHVENIQSSKRSFEYASALVGVAEAYQMMAVIHNISHVNDRGLTFWDYSWQSLQYASNAAVEMSIGLPTENWVWNGYLDTLYAKGMHCMRELKNTKADKTKARHAATAIAMFYMYLSEQIKFDPDNRWQQEEAIKMVYVAKLLGKLDDKDLDAIKNRVMENAVKNNMTTETKRALKEVSEYVFLETDKEKVQYLIY